MSYVPPSYSIQLAALRAAFPDYTFTVVLGDGKNRYEAVAKDDRTPWCLISTDSREIWHELKQAT